MAHAGRIVRLVDGHVVDDGLTSPTSPSAVA